MCSRGVKRHNLVEKWKDSVVNFRQCFNLKVGMFGQVGGRVCAGNQYLICFVLGFHWLVIVVAQHASQAGID